MWNRAPADIGLGDFIAEAAVILSLVIVNGVFAMSEIAVLSARRGSLEARARRGDRGAQRALELTNDPNAFLSTVQIGITLVGILAGAYGGVRSFAALSSVLVKVPPLAEHAESLAFVAVVVVITYVSLVIGELVPKRLALAHAEAIAVAVAQPMRLLAAAGRPAVWVLGASTDALLRLVRARLPERAKVTEEEIRRLIREGSEAGVLDVDERRMIENVFRLGDVPVRAIMTPRPEIVWIETGDSAGSIRDKVDTSRHSRFPVASGGLDRVQGVVQAKDLLSQLLAGRPLDIGGATRPGLFVPETTPAMRLLEQFRARTPHLALVIDEYGSVQGLVTVNRVVEAIIGALPSATSAPDPMVVRRDDGSWLLDGALGIDQVEAALELDRWPEGERHGYRTLGGFVMAKLGRIPATGDRFDWGGLRFEVADMDAHRVDRVIVSPAVQPGQGAP